jgi:hypothetical protein
MDRGYLMRAFFFGLGFSSTYAADALRKQQPSVDRFGTVRTPDKAELLRGDGIKAHIFDGTAPGATLGRTCDRPAM